MAEYEPTQPPRREGHFPNTGNLVLEVHRLLAIFLSSRGFAELATLPPGEGFDPVYKIQEVEEDEITRLLLTLAIHGRVIDDREGKFSDGDDFACGLLQPDLDKDDRKALGIREACNKIIHATKIRFDLEEHREQTFLNPSIYLYGSSRAKQWRAELEVVSFGKAYVKFLAISEII